MKKIFCISFFITATSFCNAQTYFVDVIPDSCVCVTATDTTSNSLTTYWDLDSDGTNDFSISVGSYFPDCMHGNEIASMTALGNNRIAGDSLCTNCNTAFMLNSGDTINTQSFWVCSSRLEYYNELSGWYGYWHDSLYPFIDSLKYVGIKFYSGTTLYYGWMQLDVVVICGLAKVLVTQYGYSSSPNNCLASINETK